MAMFTIQGLMMKTEYMMEQIRRNAIDDTIEKFKVACRHYYETSEGGDETTRLYKELEKLGANMEAVWEIDWSIRDEVFGA
jgi:hypothetical protein